MLREDVDREIERLKSRRAEISSKINSTRDFDIKEKLKDDLKHLDNQIKILEGMKKR